MFSNTLTFLTVAALAWRVRAQDPACDATNPLTPASICAIRAAFGGSTVVPDVIPSFLPVGELHTVYGNVDVGGAQQLSPSRVASTPAVSFSAVPNTKSGPKYLLVMIDHDAGENADVLHWLQTDLTVGDNNALESKVKAAAPYAGPAPPEGSGTHRYVSLLYTQPADFVLPSSLQNLPAVPESGSARLKFSLTDFVSENNLGSPAGGMFFKSTYDNVAIPSNTISDSATGALPTGAAATTTGSHSTTKSTTSTKTGTTTGSTGSSQGTSTPAASQGGSDSAASALKVGSSGLLAVLAVYMLV
ncbi:PEBP-like protein [Atractiella rhizophila]|nr:PEBP-like protein [Atractiella rhizophila]